MSHGWKQTWRQFVPQPRHWFILALLLLGINGWGVYHWQRSANAHLEVIATTPNGAVLPDTPLHITFNRPVVMPQDVGKPVTKAPWLISKGYDFQLSWVSPHILALHPTARQFPKAARLPLTITSQLLSSDGHHLARPFIWDVTTTPLRLLSLTQHERKRNGELSLQLEFDDEVSPKLLPSYLTIQAQLPKVAPVSWVIVEKKAAKILHAQLNLTPEITKVKAAIHQGLPGQSGPVGLAENFSKEFELDSQTLTIEEVTATSPAVGDLSATIQFSDEVEPDKLKPYLQIEPAVAVRLQRTYNGISLIGPFTPEQDYTLTLRPGLVSENGWPLTAASLHELSFPSRTELVRLSDSGSILRLEGHRQIAVETVNCDHFWLKLYRIYPNNFVHFLKSPHYYRAQEMGWVVAERQIPVPAQHNRLAKTMLNITEFIGKDATGPYFLSVSRESYGWNQDTMLLILTDLGITIKQTDSQLLAWITSLTKGTGVEGVNISLVTATNQKMAQLTTGKDGLATLEFSKQEGADNAPFILQAEYGNDLAVARFSKGLWNTAPFEISGQPTLTQGYRAFIYTDRGVYRPGEVAHIAAIVREASRQVPPAFPMNLEIERGDGVVVASFPVRLSDNGMTEATWQIPPEARTGFYQARLMIPGTKKEVGTWKFQVEEFVPDRLKVRVQLPENMELSAGKLPMSIHASHLYGTPAADLLVRLELSLQPKPFTHPQFSGYTFGDAKRPFKTQTIYAGDTRLDGQGQCKPEVALPQNIQPPAILEACAIATVHETGGRTVSQSAKTTVYPYPFYLGLQAQAKEIVQPGSRLPVAVVAIASNGVRVPVNNLQIRTVMVDWVWNRKLNGSDVSYEYICQERDLQYASLDLPQGDGVFQFTPEEYGQYRIVVQDLTTGMRSALDIEVWGESMSQRSGAQEYLKLEPIQKKFVAGTTAQVRLQAPFDGQALVTIERDKIYESKIVEVVAGSALLTFEVKPEYLPNVYCTATLVRPVGKKAPKYQPPRVYGIVPLWVDTQPYQLQVVMDTAPETRPQQSLAVKLQVTQDGKPVAASEVTLAAVDEGILQLTHFATPDPFAFFLGQESLQVKSADIYAQIIPEEPAGDTQSAPKAPSQPAVLVRKRFTSVAIWQSGLKTDNDGKIATTLMIPKYLGELRLMAVATHGKNFGSSQSSVRVTQPAILELSAPRFAAWGDTFALHASLRNGGKDQAPATIELHLTGGLESGKPPASLNIQYQQPQSTELAPGETWNRLYWLHATEGMDHGIIEVTSHLGQESAVESIYLPLRPPLAPAVHYQCGSLELGKTTALTIPDRWTTGTGKIELHLALQPQLTLAGGLEYLLGYPYGCVEQTTSRGFPLLYLSDLLSRTTAQRRTVSQESGQEPQSPASSPALEPLAQQERLAHRYVQAAISRLALMQTATGGLAMWPGGQTPYPWGTVYASHFLQEARKAGYAVPVPLTERLIRYLKGLAQKESAENPMDREVAAYAAYLLAGWQELPKNWVMNYGSELGKMSDVQKCFAAATLAIMGKTQEADQMFASIHKYQGVAETGGNLHSQARNLAIYLTVLLNAGDNSDRVHQLAVQLLASSQAGRWYTTQENGYVLLALGKYFAQFRSPQAQTLAGSLAGMGKNFSFSDQKEWRWDGQGDQPFTAELHLQGSGRAFYYAITQGIPLREQEQAVDAGMQIRRKLLNKNGEELGTVPVRQGDLLWVELTVQGEQAYQNLVIEELLPAGLEVENPRLFHRAEAEIDWQDQHPLNPEYMDIRDDRVQFFVHLPSTNVHKLYYPVRTVSLGQFAFPAAQVHCMYHPSLQSRNGGRGLEIGE